MTMFYTMGSPHQYGESLFTVYVTDAPVGTPPKDIWVEEFDVTSGSTSSVEDVLAAAKGVLANYPENVRVIGIVNQTDAYVMLDQYGYATADVVNGGAL